MKKKHYSIQKILSAHFIILSFGIILFLTAFFSYVLYSTSKKNALESLSYSCSSIKKEVDLQIGQMDFILLNAISSPDLQQAFTEYLKTDRSDANSFYATCKRLEDYLRMEKGSDYSIRQLNIYATDSGGYGVGNYDGELPFTVEAQSWYDSVLRAEGGRIVPRPSKDMNASAGANVGKDSYYLSLCRMFYSNTNVPLGFIEVKKYYDQFFEEIETPLGYKEARLYIYDKTGNIIYPINDSKGYDYFTGRDVEFEEITNSSTGKKEYVFYERSHDLLIVTAIQTDAILWPVYRMILLVLGFSLIVFAVCLILINYLSGRLSRPIRKIYHFLSDEKKEKYSVIELDDTGIREIDKLRDSLNENIRSTQASTNALLLLKEQEVQAQMLALQSQMNPHFLYNSLSTIAEMADEGMTGQVSQMCRDITSILRYVSSNQESRSTLEEEMENCDIYLHCMKLRYGDNLSYDYDIPDSMLECPVPKLCVQLLVENAVKFTTKVSPVWKIHVKGRISEELWELTISDNGPGFDPEIEHELRLNMDEILKSGLLPSLKIEGMGLLNVFIRLYLEDGIPFVFDFGNLKEGGAFVKIGGYIK